MLQIIPLNSEDHNLITAAEKVIEKNYKYGRHHIGSAVRTKTGKFMQQCMLKRMLEELQYVVKLWRLENLFQKAIMNLIPL